MYQAQFSKDQQNMTSNEAPTYLLFKEIFLFVKGYIWAKRHVSSTFTLT